MFLDSKLEFKEHAITMLNTISKIIVLVILKKTLMRPSSVRIYYLQVPTLSMLVSYTIKHMITNNFSQQTIQGNSTLTITGVIIEVSGELP